MSKICSICLFVKKEASALDVTFGLWFRQQTDLLLSVRAHCFLFSFTLTHRSGSPWRGCRICPCLMWSMPKVVWCLSACVAWFQMLAFIYKPDKKKLLQEWKCVGSGSFGLCACVSAWGEVHASGKCVGYRWPWYHRNSEKKLKPAGVCLCCFSRFFSHTPKNQI